jgi:hypothetical protein
MRLVLLALPALLLASPAFAQVQTRSQPITNGLTPSTTGDATCDDAVAAWRACIAASPKLPADKAQANTEVDKFMRDVVDARGPHRDDLVRACSRAAPGYRQMIENGTCAANITGARDDQATRAGARPGAVAEQRRGPR